MLFGLWLTDKVRYVAANYAALRHSSWCHQLKVLGTPHKYLIRRPMAMKNQSLWTPLTITWFSVGVLFFAAVYTLFGEPSLIIHLGTSTWQRADLLWFLPLMLLGHVLGRLYLRLIVELRRIVLGRVRLDWQLVLLGGLAIYCASLFFPAIMFSGQHNFHLLAGLWQGKTPLFLLVRSLLKLALLTICLNTGWLGGDIFPVLFCATAQGIALSQLLPQVDSVFLIAVFAISMGGTILEAPLVAGGIMMVMFLPLNLMVIGVAATVMLMVFNRLHHRMGRRYGSPFARLNGPISK